MTATISPITVFTTPVVIEQSGDVSKAESTKEEIIINKIKEVFGKDAEVMTKVAFCESGLRQFDDKGQVIKNPKTPDYGLFQINLTAHKEKLEEMKLDYRELDDNIAYAHYLFQKNGLKDWEASRKCWSK